MYQVEDTVRGTKRVASNDYWAEYFGWMEWGCIKARHQPRYIVRAL